MRIAAAICVVLAGCAVTPDRAAKMTDYDLCDIGHSGLSSDETLRNTHAEIRRRDVDCEKYRGSIMATRRAVEGMARTTDQSGQSSPGKPVVCNTYKHPDGSFSSYCQ